ncbi:MAG: DUF2804 domain-containing protein [Clostridia bacterium]|nr:DUF2804 domain-containing protein [Clostridia bacterium]
MRNHEVTVPQALLNSRDELAEPGWARQQIFRYDRAQIQAPKWRIKEWDYYLVLHDGKPAGESSYAAAFTLSDDGYVGLQSVSFLCLDEGSAWEHTSTVLNVFPMGKKPFPTSSRSGDIAFQNRDLQMQFLKRPGTRQILSSYGPFWKEKGQSLKADITLNEPEDEDTMVIATPWDKRHHFYYNQKINCMPASGSVSVGGQTYSFSPSTDYGTLDWGRGVWTYDNTWYWGSGNATVDGHRFGFNIGYGFGNTKAATENIVFVDGRCCKLDDVTIEIPGDRDLYDMDSPRYMEIWKIHESKGRFEMEFRPILDRAAKLDFKAIVSDQHQVFGRMSGVVRLDTGETLQVRDLLCFIEKVHNRY